MLTSNPRRVEISSFICPECRSAVTGTEQNLSCPACGKSWPIREGIPRFFEPSYYWGEVSSAEADAMIANARQKGWRATVLEKFENDQDSRIALLDWQRTSWLPLLALPPDCVALDIGCGYGAITNFLARGVKQLYSLEAVPQRLEFTRIRLEQEKIDNVQLVQASGLHPPFREGLFDLIVVNGVLEWVGEWSLEGDPRDVQIGFLRGIARMLKPDGVVYIGIETRFGLGAFRGVPDHSGLPYTSLLPRRVASYYLKHKKYKHNRTELNKKREYRTYTYGERGYRKLLAESGLQSTFFYRASPGYNQPYNLVPLEGGMIPAYVEIAYSEPAPGARQTWKRAVRKLIARTPVGRLACSEFIILAAKDPSVPLPAFWSRLREELPDLPELKRPLPLLETTDFHWKNIIRVFESGDTEPRCILKTSTSGLARREAFDEYYRNQMLVYDLVQRQPGCGFEVARPLGLLRREPFTYVAESAVAGASLARLAFTTRNPAGVMIAQLPRGVDCAIAIARTLRGEPRVAPIDPAWLDLPPEFRTNSTIQEALSERGESGWVQHADLTIENILIDGKRTGVIDWEHLHRGGPALYDLFSLLLSALPALPASERAGGDPWLSRFEEAFFGQGEWSSHYRAWIGQAAAHLEVPSAEIWDQFLISLLIRLNYMRPRAPSQAEAHTGFLRVASKSAGRFVIASQTRQQSGRS